MLGWVNDKFSWNKSGYTVLVHTWSAGLEMMMVLCQTLDDHFTLLTTFYTQTFSRSLKSSHQRQYLSTNRNVKMMSSYPKHKWLILYKFLLQIYSDILLHFAWFVTEFTTKDRIVMIAFSGYLLTDLIIVWSTACPTQALVRCSMLLLPSPPSVRFLTRPTFLSMKTIET